MTKIITYDPKSLEKLVRDESFRYPEEGVEQWPEEIMVIQGSLEDYKLYNKGKKQIFESNPRLLYVAVGRVPTGIHVDYHTEARNFGQSIKDRATGRIQWQQNSHTGYTHNFAKPEYFFEWLLELSKHNKDIPANFTPFNDIILRSYFHCFSKIVQYIPDFGIARDVVESFGTYTEAPGKEPVA